MLFKAVLLFSVSGDVLFEYLQLLGADVWEAA